MESEHGIFSVKLLELKQECDRLQSRIQFLEQADENQLHTERMKLKDECRAQDLKLEQTVETCRSPAVALLAGMQWDYGQQVERILQDGPREELWGHGRDSEEDRAESVTLYAEYAIDFAIQAVRHALVAVLTALELQAQAVCHKKEAEGDDLDE